MTDPNKERWEDAGVPCDMNDPEGDRKKVPQVITDAQGSVRSAVTSIVERDITQPISDDRQDSMTGDK